MAVVVPFAVYRRVRSNIGRQPLSPARLKIRLAVLLIVLSVFFGPALLDGRADAALALAAGGSLGGLIGWLALRHTQFLEDNGARYYLPHPYLGLALISLLLGRLAYRLYQVWPLMNQPGGVPPTPLSTLSPWTLGLLGMLLVYNATFSLGLLRESAKPAR